jgi:hypothetical protein
MAVRSEAEEQRELLARGAAAIPEPRARPGAAGSVVRAASRPVAAAASPAREVGREPQRPAVHRAAPAEGARETAAAQLGNSLQEQVAVRAPVPQELAVVRAPLEAEEAEAREQEVREREVRWAPVETLAAQGRAAAVPRERGA